MVSTKRSSTNTTPSLSSASTSTSNTDSNEAATGTTFTRATTSSSNSNPAATNKIMPASEGNVKHLESNCAVCSRYKEGERVLCFEPDPTKVRVVYDAKILQISVTTDEKRSKNNHEFLVHFQGWNASWDRFVPQSYLLKVFL